MTHRVSLQRSSKMIVLAVVLVATLASAANFPYLVYVGTYTDKGSKGIYAFRFDPGSGESESLGLVAETQNPSFLVVGRDSTFLYAVNEVDDFGPVKTGAISIFAIDRVTAKLTPLQQVSSAGAGPAHISLDQTGHYVLVANYDSGNIAVFPVEKDGRLGSRTAFVQHAGSSVNKDRQSGPHAHEIQTSNDNQFVLAADLGLDKLMVYRFDAKTGSLTPNDPPSVKVSPGSGPRHFAIAPSGKAIY